MDLKREHKDVQYKQYEYDVGYRASARSLVSIRILIQAGFLYVCRGAS